MNFDAAADYYTQAAIHSKRSDPFLSAESFCRAATIHSLAFNNTAKSFELFRSAHAINPQHPGAMRGIGAVYAASGEVFSLRCVPLVVLLGGSVIFLCLRGAPEVIGISLCWRLLGVCVVLVSVHTARASTIP
jgi:hypothetical protein